MIAGPTGSGKSALAISVAKQFRGEIINYDSVQVYQGLNIGSAKTPAAERQGVPHHLMDILSPLEELTAGAYANLSRACLLETAGRGALPVLVGGTGFYLRSLLEGLSPAPSRNEDLRVRLAAVAERRPGALHRFLRRADREAAERIHANDHQKLIRAIELASTASAPPPPREPLTGFRIIGIALNPPRAELYARLNQRVVKMFESGLLAETQSLMDNGVPPHGKALQTLGYKQAVGVIEGRLTQEQAVEELQTKTRQYAKRQLTWFRNQHHFRWLDGFGDEVEVVGEASRMVEAELTG